MTTPWRLHRFPILDSTNDLALAWIRAGRAAPGDVIVADEQTGGRGRPGRRWHSPRGALLCTLLLPFRPERVGWTALAAGIGVARAVRALGAPAGVKWPNDVVLDGRKLAGILVETSSPEIAAVGIGLNVSNPLPDDPELAVRAARLADTLPGATVEAMLEAVLSETRTAWERLLAPDLEPLREQWAALDTTAGRKVRWSAEGIAATAEGVDPSGALRLRRGDGTLALAQVGEVVFL